MIEPLCTGNKYYYCINAFIENGHVTNVQFSIMYMYHRFSVTTEVSQQGNFSCLITCLEMLRIHS